MEMLFVVLVYFSNGNFQSMEVIETSRAEAELGAAANKTAACNVGLAKPLAAQRNKAVKRMPARKIHYGCLSASQIGSFEATVGQANNWPSVSGK